MPSIAVTCIVVVTVMRGIVNSQVKQHETVTAVFVCCQEGRCSCAGVISAAMPRRAVTSGDEFCYCIAHVDC